MLELTFYRPGCRVSIDCRGVPFSGCVLRVAFGFGDSIEYEVAWWDGRNRQVRWLAAAEVMSHVNSEQQTIGFHAEAGG